MSGVNIDAYMPLSGIPIHQLEDFTIWMDCTERQRITLMDDTYVLRADYNSWLVQRNKQNAAANRNGNGNMCPTCA